MAVGRTIKTGLPQKRISLELLTYLVLFQEEILNFTRLHCMNEYL